MVRNVVVRLAFLCALLWSTANAEAAVVCQKKSGALSVRETACKKRETQVDVTSLLGDLPTRVGSVETSISTLQSSVSTLQSMSFAPTPADERFSVMWQVSGGVHHVAVRGDGSIRDTDDPSVVVVHVTVGQWCITAPGAFEGAVGVLQDQGGANGTIEVSMGIGSFCNSVSGSNITVETFSF